MNSPPSPADEVDRAGSTALVGLMFFASGVPALVYQMAWQRILALHSGVGIYSVAMIVALFMAGLGLGSHMGGLLSRRLEPRAALRAFGWIELGIGLCGAVSAPLYYDVLYLRAGWLYGHTWSAALGHFLALIVPTCLMGMSLPVLVRAMVRDVASAGRTIGFLYGVNVIGAAVGAAVTPWLLMRFWGIRGAIGCGVAVNVAVGLAAWWMSGRGQSVVGDRWSEVRRADHRLPITDHRDYRPPFALWIALYALGGFTGLALEMLWFRLCDVAAKSTAFTFGTVLAVYLFGLGVGSLIGVSWLERVRRPLRAFLICQCLILIYACGAVLLLVHAPTDAPLIAGLMKYWREYEGAAPGSSAAADLLMLYVALPTALFGVPTMLMGFSFCVLQRAVQDDRRTSGFKVGALQAANIAGCVAGSLVVGLWLLNAVGTTGTLTSLALLGVALSLIGVRSYGARSVFVPLGLALAGLAYSLPDQESLWLRLHGVDPEAGVAALVDEDATGVAALTPEIDVDVGLRLSVDGKGHSWLPYHSSHSYLGALPAVVHPAPERVAIVGLGSGDTAWAAACREETREVKVYELCAPELRLLEQLVATGFFPQVNGFLRDPRIEILVADGRNALARSDERYDVIEADASRPNSAYSGNLYSIEFFVLCASRLKPGGLMCTWSPTPRVYVTFCQAFPHVVEVNGGDILLGSNEPLPMDAPEWQSRLRANAVKAYLGTAIVQGVGKCIESARPADAASRGAIEPNRDLFPRDEFLSPQ